MLGLGELFDYQECSDCGTVQIREPPVDMARYYPPHRYYSFRSKEQPPVGRLKGLLRRQRNKYLAGSITPIGRILAGFKPRRDLDFLRTLKIEPDHRILDIGCGQGSLLSTLAQLGYRQLLGADPFIEKNIYADGYNIKKATIKELQPAFDLIMFHHSLEHVIDPVDALKDVCRLLGKRGVCLVRLPTPSSDVYAQYGPLWVNLDAPRHFVIPSRQGMSIASKIAGLRIVTSKDEMTAFSHWGSEQYRCGIPLESPRSYAVSPAQSEFTPADIERFSRMARDANARQRGDWVQFILARED